MRKSYLTVIAMIALSVISLARADMKHTFVLDCNAWDEKPGKVTVAGSFNGWSKDATVLEKTDGHVWKGTFSLPEGQYTYKFVIDGERYISDPKGDKDLEEDDTYGGKNSGVIVGPDARKMPPPKPNDINTNALIHDPQSVDDVNVVSDRQLRLRVRALKDDVEKVYIHLPSQPDGARRVELHKLETTKLGYDVFGGAIEVSGAKVEYVVQFVDGGREEILSKGRIPATAHFNPFTVAMKPLFTTPDWAKTAVWYQIFPERFRNGDPANDPNTRKHEHVVPWTAKWYEPAPGETPGDENFYKGTGNVWNRRYGGDLAGLRQSLPYLRKLGITAIYLNPIFEAESMHKYDTSDFRHVDDNFGVKGDNTVAAAPRPDDKQQPQASLKADVVAETDDPATWKWTQTDLLFLDFVAEAHKQGFKVVLDGVFNHVGRAHPFFQDVLEKGKNSKYADWFEITDWGDESNWKKLDDPYTVHGKAGGIQWKAWDEVNGHLPAFKKDAEKGLAPGPYAHVMAITTRWLAPDGDASRGIDGWRLDVANDIPHGFWRDWRKVVKQTKPDAYISGEIWSGAEPWINKGDQFDAVMNYQFAMPAQDFFVDVSTATSPSVFAQQLARLCFRYPFQSALVMMNLFDSHDTDRLPSMFVNPDRPYDGKNRLQDNGPDYSPRKPDAAARTRMTQAVALQHTFVGAPMTYYGNEAGMWSADDPSNRQPMVWQDLEPYADPEVKFDKDLFDFFRRCIATRAALPALQTGEFFPVLTDDASGVLVFGRRLGRQTAYVVINRGAAPRDVTFNVSPAEAAKAFVNYFDPAHVDLLDPSADAGARSTVKVKDNSPAIEAVGGKLTVALPAYGSAVLAAK
jgi:glycosidase